MSGLRRSDLLDELASFRLLAAKAKVAGLEHLPAAATDEARALSAFLQDADVDE
jgi:hypothetical protein